MIVAFHESKTRWQTARPDGSPFPAEESRKWRECADLRKLLPVRRSPSGFLTFYCRLPGYFIVLIVEPRPKVAGSGETPNFDYNKPTTTTASAFRAVKADPRSKLEVIEVLIDSRRY